VDNKTGLYTAAVAILAGGLAVALLIYLTAGDDAANLALQEMVGSKRYVRELQRFGGKSAVLFDELSRWFEGLWRGKSLGVTIAWLSVFTSLGVYLVARRLR